MIPRLGACLRSSPVYDLPLYLLPCVSQAASTALAGHLYSSLEIGTSADDVSSGASAKSSSEHGPSPCGCSSPASDLASRRPPAPQGDSPLRAVGSCSRGGDAELEVAPSIRPCACAQQRHHGSGADSTTRLTYSPVAASRSCRGSSTVQGRQAQQQASATANASEAAAPRCQPPVAMEQASGTRRYATSAAPVPARALHEDVYQQREMVPGSVLAQAANPALVLPHISTMGVASPGALWPLRLQGYYQDLVYPVYNKRREKVGEVALPGDIFDTPIRRDILNRMQRWWGRRNQWNPVQSRRKWDFFGGHRKPWPQKYTGRARHGSLHAAIWHRRGAKPNGPHRTSKAVRFCYFMRREAMKIALSSRVWEGRMIVVDDMSLASDHPGELQRVVDSLLLDAPRRNALLVDCGRLEADQGAAMRTAFREVNGCNVRSFENLQAFEILENDQLLISLRALEVATALLQAPLAKPPVYQPSTDPVHFGNIEARYPLQRLIENGMVIWEDETVLDPAPFMEIPPLESPFQGEVDYHDEKTTWPRGRNYFRNDWGTWSAINPHPFLVKDLFDCPHFKQEEEVCYCMVRLIKY